MAKKQKRFADDGWAVWVDGDDISTIYLNHWLNPKGKSYVDMAIRIRSVRVSSCLYVYVPFPITSEEIEDISLRFNDTKILQATFSAVCLVDYMKNACASEIAYNGKTIDIVHISKVEYQTEPLASGTLMKIDLLKLQPFFDNDEVYFIWRMPQKSLDEIFKPHVDVQNVVEKFLDLITTPVVSQKYGYSIRINEARLLPEEITRIGAFHRQKLRKAVITISVDENYELNDAGCYRIRRLEENLYRNYLPEDYNLDDVITYQWQQSRERNLKGQFNFYYSIAKNSISGASMILYMVLLFAVGILSDIVSAGFHAFLSFFS